jgi:transposase-like protein
MRRLTPRKLTPARKRVLVRRLRAGARLDQAASAAGIGAGLLGTWIGKGAHGHPHYAALAAAVVAGRELVHRQELELVGHAVRLLETGETIRATAKALGVAYDVLRVRVRRARRGELGLEALAWAAEGRSRVRETCPHCGAPMRAQVRRAA